MVLSRLYRSPENIYKSCRIVVGNIRYTYIISKRSMHFGESASTWDRFHMNYNVLRQIIRAVTML